MRTTPDGFAGRPAERSAGRKGLAKPSGRGVRVAAAAVGLLLGTMLLAIGASYARRGRSPSRNLVGNPGLETLLQRCEVPSARAVMRLYRGDPGATVEAWWTVTLERPGAPEAQVWFSARTPVVTAIACGPDSVQVLGEPGTGALATYPISEIERELVPRPVVWLGGHERRVSRDSVVAAGGPDFRRLDRGVGVTALIIGAAVTALGGWGLARARRA